jgi:hypothetical protein
MDEEELIELPGNNLVRIYVYQYCHHRDKAHKKRELLLKSNPATGASTSRCLNLHIHRSIIVKLH